MKAENKDKTNSDLKDRTKQFALRIIRLYSSLPQTTAAQVLGKQLLRSGTSVGANYRESCRARTNAEFISKTNISLQELEETAYWIELLKETELIEPELLGPLYNEVDELIAIFVSINKKVRRKTEKGRLKDEG